MPDDAPFLLDVTRLIWRRWKGRLPTGIDRVCLAYLRHFGPKSQAVVNHERFRRILGPETSQRLFALLAEPAHFRKKLIAGVLRHVGDFRSDGRGRPYLNLGHTGLDSRGFREWLSTAGVKPIYLVHDLIPITNPEFCRPGEDDRHRARMRTVLTSAAGVIGNSKVTLDDLEQFARVEDLPCPPMLAAWLGVDAPNARPEVRPVRPTFIVLGTIEGRKNHMLLLDVWSKLIDRIGQQAPRLLIIGQRGWQAQDVFDRLDSSDKLRGHVIELNNCLDDELAAHLASARALLFPSFVEGYGLPLIEALGAGLPAIASHLPVFREMCGDIPTYLSPLDQDGWHDAILDYARPESEARALQVERLKGFQPASWEAHFSKVEEWLESFSVSSPGAQAST